MKMTSKPVCLPVVFCLLLLSVSVRIHGSEMPSPLRALLITGGCCHDYTAQKKILTEGISARARVTWTVVHEAVKNERDHEFSVYKDLNWAAGYDVVVHNECSGAMTNVSVVERIVSAHTNGVPAVMIHCSMHSYRHAPTEEWQKLTGVTSMKHQHHAPFEVKNLKPEHPVMKGFPETWQTRNGELYEIDKVWPDAIPLAQAFGTRSQKDHPCIWVNTYGKARVFSTTIGHFNEEMDNDVFLGLVTRGLLWACDKLTEDGLPKQGFANERK